MDHEKTPDPLVSRLINWWRDPTEGMTGQEAYTDELIQEAAAEIRKLQAVLTEVMNDPRTPAWIEEKARCALAADL